jgi:hypothetical protein
MKTSLDFISIGCNRVSGCSDWSKENNIFAFAAHKSVVFYQVEVYFSIYLKIRKIKLR